jgi:hypothetical protein
MGCALINIYLLRIDGLRIGDGLVAHFSALLS